MRGPDGLDRRSGRAGLADGGRQHRRTGGWRGRRGRVHHRGPLPLPSKPSIVVMPLANLSGDAEQDYFADGMMVEITNALSRIKTIFVIASARKPHLQGQGRQLEIDRPTTRRPLSAGGQCPQSRRARAHRGPADRRHRRGAGLGRPVRRSARRYDVLSARTRSPWSPPTRSSRRGGLEPKSGARRSAGPGCIGCYDLYLCAPPSPPCQAPRGRAAAGARPIGPRHRPRSQLWCGAVFGGSLSLPDCQFRMVAGRPGRQAAQRGVGACGDPGGGRRRRGAHPGDQYRRLPRRRLRHFCPPPG